MVNSKKLRSSMKALQHAIAPICLQEAKTDSFRGLNSSFNSIIYCTPSTISTPPPPPASSSSSSSPLDDALAPKRLEAEELPAKLLSDRFFFSPCISKSILEEVKASNSGVELAMAMEMASDDPYSDFRLSMEEMVEAHELREWPQLQKLLHSYLRLNDKETHEIIVLAFFDILLHPTHPPLKL